MNHDRLFKELLTNFFAEFVELFLPNVSTYLAQDTVFVPLDKEIFTDVTLGNTHEVDLLVRAKFRDDEAFFLVHIENQSTSQSDFAKRMFRYFARLTEKYDLPVYPVVIYSHDKPQLAEPDSYEIRFPDKRILRFEYTVIQLNRLSWRQFVNKDNPVAGALMAKMNMAKEDRPKVKLECFRLLARLKLDPARSKLIGGFVESYLKLTELETKQFERQLFGLNTMERIETMSLVSSWEQKGIEQGIERGKHEILTRQIERRFGIQVVGRHIDECLSQLSSTLLDDLAVALLDFVGIADLEKWLQHHVPTKS